jgi:hypothetical protein
MTIATGLGDRRPMKLWSWLGAVEKELLNSNPIEFAAGLTPDLLDRVVELGPKVAKWLLAVAKAAELMKQRSE